MPLTRVDPVQIQAVLFNLIENAEQALSEFHGQGKITVKTKVRGDHIKIIVSDDGPGISEPNSLKIFNPLFTTKKGKVGLGLSISHRILEAHGGKLGVRSKQTKGASFIITLPVTRELDEKETEK